MDLDQETTELLYPIYDEDPLDVKNSDDEYDMEATEVRFFSKLGSAFVKHADPETSN